jgi:hypothetical protein
MSFREQKTTCPRCLTLLAIDAVLIDERATVRIMGHCLNPFCIVDEVQRDVDPLQVAAAQSTLNRVARQRPALPLAGCGN